ncbi:MAG: hypothetical protein H6838_10710 [Planctomycetes bacterium]|nr:hypothetical protein [Planctomycetota bacterium]MCB9885957.1 hypothetical protein [Planctomycetota bacterium]
MKTLLSLSLAAVCVGSLAAQSNNDVGFTRGWNTSYTTRAGANNIEADVLLHFDSRDYQDFILDPADPTGSNYLVKAIRFVIQDQIGNTPEMYSIAGYHEDPLNPEFPDAAAPWFRTGLVSLPASTVTTPVAWNVTVTLPATVMAAPKGDKWFGIGLSVPTGTTWPTDGVSVHAAYDRSLTSTVTVNSDVAGPGIASAANGGQYTCYMPTPGGVPTGPATYPAGNPGSRIHLNLELIADVAGGVCVTQTNQTTYPASNPVGTTTLPLGGTTNFFSGLHPDVYDANLQPTPRADDIGFVVSDNSSPIMPAFLMVAFGPSPIGSLPLNVIAPSTAHPGTKGNVCIDFTTAVTFFGLTDAAGVYQQMLTLSPSARQIIQSLSLPNQPFDIWYQGFVLNLASGTGPTLEVHATGCGVQHL